MSAMSLRQAWSRGSRRTEGPSREMRRSVLEEDSPFLGRAAAAGAGAFLLLDVAFEALKEFLPYAGLGDADIAAVRLVAHAAQIAERAQRIQGARDDGLGYAQYVGEAAHRVGAGGEVDEEQQRHLAVGEVGLSGPDVADQRLHPASEGALCHWLISEFQAACSGSLTSQGRFRFVKY